MESPKFGYDVNKFCDAFLTAGKVLGIHGTKELVSDDGRLKDVLEDDMDHEVAADESLDAFASLDCFFVFGLEKLNVEGLKRMVHVLSGVGPS